ncbi:hypothetical protein DFH27DRAFT_617114 [Peziza echinospora]|nr:hypothetical protein DFH27DRAFT_617114 [Peziza echinospora]
MLPRKFHRNRRPMLLSEDIFGLHAFGKDLPKFWKAMMMMAKSQLPLTCNRPQNDGLRLAKCLDLLYPLAHLLEGLWKAAIGIPLRRKGREIDLTSDGVNDESDGERTLKVVKESRSVHTLPTNIKLMTQAASEYILDYVHFENPLPDVREVLELIADAWAHDCRVTGTFHDQAAKAHLKSVLSRTRSLSVSTFKNIAPELFKFKGLGAEEIRTLVEYLLEDD